MVTPEIMWSGHETDKSPLSSAEFKNAWSYNSTSQYIFMAWHLIKQWIRFESVALLHKDIIKLILMITFKLAVICNA
jgi:hypothetical protein